MPAPPWPPRLRTGAAMPPQTPARKPAGFPSSVSWLCRSFVAAREGRDDLRLAADAEQPARLREDHGMAGAPTQHDERLQRDGRGCDDHRTLALGAGLFLRDHAQGMGLAVEAKLGRLVRRAEAKTIAPRRVEEEGAVRPIHPVAGAHDDLPGTQLDRVHARIVLCDQ